MTAITHFMWGYQIHFRIRLEQSARSHFQSMDPALEPEVFVIGVLDGPSNDRHPGCVEPEKDFWLESKELDGVANQARQLILGYPETQLMHSHPLAQQRHDDQLFRRAIRDAAQSVIEACPRKPAGTRYQLSMPCRVDQHWVMVVIGLPEAAFGKHPSLKISTGHIHEYRPFRLCTSLLDALLTIFLEQAHEQLSRPNPGNDFERHEVAETMRKAGRHLMEHIAWRVDRDRFAGRETILTACNTISSLFYEKAVGHGKLVLARKDHPAIRAQLRFPRPPQLQDFRGARKLLETTLSKLPLHSDTEELFGLVSITDYDGAGEDLFEVEIIGHHHWELRHAGLTLMRVSYGQPALPRPTFNRQKLRSDLQRIFRDSPVVNHDKLVALVEQAERESHGTTLVISAAAAAEAARLAPQATLIEPHELNADLLKHLTPIDGALLIGPDATCHAIGVILDGDATDQGDAARGARYNSAVRYVASRDHACLAVVVSSDGGIDFRPDLRPTIARSAIDQALGRLQSMTAANWRTFCDLVRWLERHAFYLLPADCDLANREIARIDQDSETSDPAGVRIVRSPFRADPTMDATLYYADTETTN